MCLDGHSPCAGCWESRRWTAWSSFIPFYKGQIPWEINREGFPTSVSWPRDSSISATVVLESWDDGGVPSTYVSVSQSSWSPLSNCSFNLGPLVANDGTRERDRKRSWKVGSSRSILADIVEDSKGLYILGQNERGRDEVSVKAWAIREDWARVNRSRSRGWQWLLVVKRGDQPTRAMRPSLGLGKGSNSHLAETFLWSSGYLRGFWNLILCLSSNVYYCVLLLLDLWVFFWQLST